MISFFIMESPATSLELKIAAADSKESKPFSRLEDSVRVNHSWMIAGKMEALWMMLSMVMIYRPIFFTLLFCKEVPKSK